MLEVKKKMLRNIILEGKNQNIWIQWLIPYGHVYIAFIVNESDNVGGFPSQRASDAKKNFHVMTSSQEVFSMATNMNSTPPLPAWPLLFEQSGMPGSPAYQG